MSIVMGVDPGTRGACYILEDGKKIDSFVYPIGVDGTIDRKKLAVKIYNINKKHKDLFVVIEHVQAMFGKSAKSTFNFGRNVEIINTIVEIFNIRHIYVKPVVWQKISWEGVKKIYKTPKSNGKNARKSVDTKKTSLLAASKLFPKDDFLATKRSSVPHDGLVDASLIAWYGYIKGY